MDNFEGDLSLEVSGGARLIALDNGDHFTDRRLDQPVTSLYRGGALAILRPTAEGGAVEVRAACDGIRNASMRIGGK